MNLYFGFEKLLLRGPIQWMNRRIVDRVEDVMTCENVVVDIFESMTYIDFC